MAWHTDLCFRSFSFCTRLFKVNVDVTVRPAFYIQSYGSLRSRGLRILFQSFSGNWIKLYFLSSISVLTMRLLPEYVLRKIYHCTFWANNFSTTLLGFYRKTFHFISQKIMITFFSHRPFLRISALKYYPHTHHHPLYTHRHTAFSVSTPYFLLFITVNTAYAVYSSYFITAQAAFITAHFRSSLHIVCINAR